MDENGEGWTERREDILEASEDAVEMARDPEG